MSKQSTERAAELAALLARHYPEAPYVAVARVVLAMQKAARVAVRWETRRCNEPMTEEQDDRGRRRLARLAVRLDDVLATAGLRGAAYPGDRPKHGDPACVRLGGDPRGACAYLIVPGERGDGWGAGFAIY